MKRKMLIAIMIGVVFISQAGAGSYLAGDVMPNFQIRTSLMAQKIFNYQGFDVLSQTYHLNGIKKYKVFFSVLSGSARPFLVFDIENNILYIDNASNDGSHSPDGFIDRIKAADSPIDHILYYPK